MNTFSIKICLPFFQFLFEVLELFECRQRVSFFFHIWKLFSSFTNDLVIHQRLDLDEFTHYRISKFVLEKKLRLIENARKWPKEWVHVLLLQPFLLFQSLYPPILNRPFI